MGILIKFNEETHKYTLIEQGVETPCNLSVTQALKILGVTPDYTNIPPLVLERAARKGTYCHKALELIRQLVQFEEDYENDRYSDLIIPTSEAMYRGKYCSIYNELKVVFKFRNLIIGGGIDEVGKTDSGEFYICDFKFTSSYHEQAVEFQLNFYKYALEWLQENYSDNLRLLPKDFQITKLMCNHKGIIHELKIYSREEMEHILECVCNNEKYDIGNIQE